MTREEAARVLTELADEYEKYELSKNGWLGTTYIPAHRMGVAALREALERGQGCEYCEKGKRIKNACYTNAFAEVCKHSKSFAVHMPLNFGSADCDFFINYCPMCGRKLEEEG